MPSKDWFEILELCRAMPNSKPTVPITAAELARVAGFEDTVGKVSDDGNTLTKGSKKNQIASAWLAKLTKWKYLEISGKDTSGGKRPANIYSLTKLGLECPRRDMKSQRPQEAAGEADLELQGAKDSKERLALARLLDAIYEFSSKRGTKEDETAFQTLLFTAQEIAEQEGFQV